MTGIETLAMVASVAGTVVSALGTIAGGKQANLNAQAEAERLEQAAGQERAAAQRKAVEKRREAEFAQSRLQALAAASGGGALDPGVVTLDQGLTEAGEMGALTALFEGEEAARGREDAAYLRRVSGKQAQAAGVSGAMGTLFKGAPTILKQGKSLLEKYG